MTLIVKTITRLTIGLILLFGIYIVSHGHLSPGGGFAGGLIIALSFIHMMLAFGREKALDKISADGIAFFESFGAFLFWALGMLGLAFGYFLLNFPGKGEPFRLFSSGIIPLYNVAIAFKVGAGLFTIFMALVFIKIKVKKEKKEK
jgi:multicomponent Na+:H+ antiporter subunit B